MQRAQNKKERTKAQMRETNKLKGRKPMTKKMK